jgi:hypothetical protein
MKLWITHSQSLRKKPHELMHQPNITLRYCYGKQYYCLIRMIIIFVSKIIFQCNALLSTTRKVHWFIFFIPSYFSAWSAAGTWLMILNSTHSIFSSYSYLLLKSISSTPAQIYRNDHTEPLIPTCILVQIRLMTISNKYWDEEYYLLGFNAM